MDKENKYNTGNLIANNENSSYKKTLIKMMCKITTIPKIYSSKIQEIGFSFLKFQSKLAKSMLSIYSPVQKTIQLMQKGLETLYRDIQTIINTIPKVNLNPLISFYNNIKHFDFNISKEQKKEEIVNDIATATTEIIKSKKITTREKRNIFKTFFSKLTGIIKTFFVLIILPLLISEVIPKQIAIFEAKQEISQLEYHQKDNEIKLQYRYITHKARLYKNRKLKTKIDDLEIGEIVIVLEEDKEKLKVQILDTEEIGWILKKYSKRI